MDVPLTGRTENAPGKMTAQVLRYANRAKVAEALTAQGYEVSRMTVNRWASGHEMPAIAERMVLALFGHASDDTTEPPPWARALSDELVREITENRRVLAAQLGAIVGHAVSDALATLRSQPLGESAPRGRRAPERP